MSLEAQENRRKITRYVPKCPDSQNKNSLQGKPLGQEDFKPTKLCKKIDFSASESIRMSPRLKDQMGANSGVCCIPRPIFDSEEKDLSELDVLREEPPEDQVSTMSKLSEINKISDDIEKILRDLDKNQSMMIENESPSPASNQGISNKTQKLASTLELIHTPGSTDSRQSKKKGRSNSTNPPNNRFDTPFLKNSFPDGLKNISEEGDDEEEDQERLRTSQNSFSFSKHISFHDENNGEAIKDEHLESNTPFNTHQSFEEKQGKDESEAIEDEEELNEIEDLLAFKKKEKQMITAEELWIERANYAMEENDRLRSVLGSIDTGNCPGVNEKLLSLISFVSQANNRLEQIVLSSNDQVTSLHKKASQQKSEMEGLKRTIYELSKERDTLIIRHRNTSEKLSRLTVQKENLNQYASHQASLEKELANLKIKYQETFKECMGVKEENGKLRDLFLGVYEKLCFLPEQNSLEKGTNKVTSPQIRSTNNTSRCGLNGTLTPLNGSTIGNGNNGAPQRSMHNSSLHSVPNTNWTIPPISSVLGQSNPNNMQECQKRVYRSFTKKELKELQETFHREIDRLIEENSKNKAELRKSEDAKAVLSQKISEKERSQEKMAKNYENELVKRENELKELKNAWEEQEKRQESSNMNFELMKKRVDEMLEKYRFLLGKFKEFAQKRVQEMIMSVQNQSFESQKTISTSNKDSPQFVNFENNGNGMNKFCFSGKGEGKRTISNQETVKYKRNLK